jgi:integrase/recombinase XerD
VSKLFKKAARETMETPKPAEIGALVPAGLAPVGEIVVIDALSGRDGTNRSRASNRQLDADTDQHAVLA